MRGKNSSIADQFQRMRSDLAAEMRKGGQCDFRPYARRLAHGDEDGVRVTLTGFF